MVTTFRNQFRNKVFIFHSDGGFGEENDFSIQNGIAGKILISEVKQVFSQKSIQPKQGEFSLRLNNTKYSKNIHLSKTMDMKEVFPLRKKSILYYRKKKPALENPLCGAFAIIHGFYTNEQKLSNQIGRSKLCETF